ncbi:MAG: AAA family ATPase [Clostridiaceae bacterium]|nr:AAA family ATPase [Clostridiaceae bacterium]
MQDRERAYEEKRLNRTLYEIERQLQQMHAIEKSFVNNIRKTYKNMWEEVENAPNDLQDMDQLVQAKLYLDEMRNLETTYKSAAERIVQLRKMQNSPYFARIDFLEDGERAPEQIYIGISMVQNEETLEIFVYDWRAPISGMFYDYDTGRAGFDTPSGYIKGELVLKRQFKIENGKIKYMFDSDVKIDDDILQEVLGQSKDEKMKTIVTSIQREQNKAIRDEGHKLLIVEGPAGSGKTSIALHRVAFLLYRYRNTISNDSVVILSPNDMFNDYISEVLPELGEENVRQTTFMAFAKGFLKTSLLITDLNEQMEYILTAKNSEEYNIRLKSIGYKSSIWFLKKLEEYTKHLYKKPWEFEDIEVNNNVIITGEEQRALFQREYTYLPMVPRLKKIRNRVLYLIKQQEYKQISKLYEKLKKDPTMADLRSYEKRRIAIKTVLKQFKPLREKARLIGKISVIDVYRKMFDGSYMLDEELSDVSKFTLEQLEQGIILYEDLAPILYLKGKLYGIPQKDNIRHVVVDEAQDYTPLQMKIIHELFPSSNFTVVGDLNQSLNPYANIGNTEALADIFKTQSVSHIKLSRSYRSTREITRFVNYITGIETGSELINRTGKLPLVRVIQSVDDCINGIKKDIDGMIAEGYRSVAVIARNSKEAEMIYRCLSKSIACNLVVKSETSFPRGITVMPSYLSKGLEFDVVFVLNLDNPYTGKEEENLFYTVCSRALHRLCIYTLDKLPEYLNNMPEDYYILS